MAGFYTTKRLDYSGEATTTRLRIPELNAGNIAAVTALMTTLEATLNDVSYTSAQGFTYGNVDPSATVGQKSAFPESQREFKFVVQYLGANDKKYTASFGCVDLGAGALELLDGKDDIDWAGTNAAALLAAFEALVVDEAGGAVTIQGGYITGRNS